MKVITAAEVISALAKNAHASPAKRAAANRKRNRYVAQQVSLGKDAKQVNAAIKAHVTRRLPQS